MGRARVEKNKLSQLTNIQKNKEKALNALIIQYARADKAKTSFGYIGTIFLAVLFGSIFLNDFIKLCIYNINGWREWQRDNNNDRVRENNENDQREQVEIEMDRVYGNELEEKLERVYIKLLQVNSNSRKK